MDQCLTTWRRMAARSLAVAIVLGCLAGCTTEQIDEILSDCPTTDTVAWAPDVAHPVLWGFQEVGPAEGAPKPMRIYYPTLASSPHNAPIAKHCLVRYPMVLFLHGQPPRRPPVTVDSLEYYKRFEWIGADLARSGYVVVAPRQGFSGTPNLPSSQAAPALVADALASLNWARTQWSESAWVDKRRQAAVAGHSYGALLAARVAASTPEVEGKPDIQALVSFSGPYTELNDAPDLFPSITVPAFYMWGRDLDFEDIDEPPTPFGPPTTQPKYAAEFNGRHFDYLEDAGADPRGPCAGMPAAAAHLATLFLARHYPASLQSPDSSVPIDLKRPQVSLTAEQTSFANGHLVGLNPMIGTDCRIDMRWEAGGTKGSRTLSS